jgi:aspartate aminotransferase
LDSKYRISKYISSIKPSATAEASFLANKLKNEGIDIINFSQGQPDFDTPENIKNAAKSAIDNGFTKYTDIQGIYELRNAVKNKFKRENGIIYEEDQIIITNGGKQALYQAFRTICEEGDEVLVPIPCYVSYIEQIKLAGAKPVFLNTKENNNFRITLKDILKHYNPNIKAIIINTPNNPTGSIIEEEELKKIIAFLIDHEVLIIVDEVYEHLIYDDKKHISVASLGEEAKKMSITINSLSKTYAMTGWRVGYAAGSKEIIRGMINLQSHVSGNINSIAQKASLEALNGNQKSVRSMVKEYSKRRKYLVNRINNLTGIQCHFPDGAFYVFPNIASLFGKKYNNKVINNDIDVVRYFLEEAHVAVVPGSAFCYPGYVRFVFSKSIEELEEGMDRIDKAIMKLY